MNSSRLKLTLPAAVGLAVVCATLLAQTKPTTQPSLFPTAESVVTELYRLVSFEPGAPPDWQKVRSLFIDEAVVVLRTARDKTTVFSVQGFVEDFQRFIEHADAEQKGFTERIVRMKPLVFGDIAHVLVLYEASLSGSDRPPTRGIDSFQLVRKDGRWWIVSIVNEICTPDRPLPRELRE
jgi:hypothetical protein